MPQGQATQTRTSKVQTLDKSKPLASIELWSQQATEKLSYYPVMSSSDDTVQITVWATSNAKGGRKKSKRYERAPSNNHSPTSSHMVEHPPPQHQIRIMSMLEPRRTTGDPFTSMTKPIANGRVSKTRIIRCRRIGAVDGGYIYM